MHHPWSDSDVDSEVGGHPWSVSEASSEHDWDSDVAEGKERTPAQLLVDFLVDLLLCRALNAKSFCIIMHYCGLCGIESCSALGKKPDLPSGHYQRHLESALPVFRDSAVEYEFKVPCSTKNKPGRDSMWLPALVLQEELDAELRGNPGWAEQLQHCISDNLFPPTYDTHPLVAGSQSRVVPLALFVDAVPYSNVDSIIGFWVVNLMTQVRHLIVALRKSVLCKCGCKGWCTFWAVFHYLHWCFAVASTGRYADGRHDSLPWRQTDDDRASMVGAEALAVYCLLFIKGDWAEYASTLGFPSWNSAIRPCFGCNCTVWDMFELLGVGPFNCPHYINGESDYFEACSRAEANVEIPSALAHAAICQLLFWDKRDGGNIGLSMRSDLLFWDNAPLGLLAGDRVEPTPELQDVADVFTLSHFPATVTFWRRSFEYIARHRNPLFDESLGITPHRCMTADTLHVIYLGIMLRLCRVILWMTLLSGVLVSASNLEELLSVSVLVLQNQLSAWYKRRHSANPQEMLTRYHLRESKIGTRSAPTFKAKAAETYGFMLFLLDLLDQVHERMPDPARAVRLLKAGRALEHLLGIWREGGGRLSAAEQVRCWECFDVFVASTHEEPECDIPKRHMLFHILQRMPDQGNPKIYANWLDETLNRHLKLCCRDVSQVHFERSLYCRMRARLQRFFADKTEPS